ncbi:unnamed protein product, partial [Amoebophrya sp. A120]|eukprot:GSA120T00005363001.1
MSSTAEGDGGHHYGERISEPGSVPADGDVEPPTPRRRKTRTHSAEMRRAQATSVTGGVCSLLLNNLLCGMDDEEEEEKQQQKPVDDDREVEVDVDHQLDGRSRTSETTTTLCQQENAPEVDEDVHPASEVGVVHNE